MKAKIRDTEIFFDVLGEAIEYKDNIVHEKPVMFCVHGGPGGDHSAFKKYCGQLQHDVQLILFDHRGSGRSLRGDPATYSLENNVDDMEALRQHLGLESIIVYGHSYGGVVATAYALKYPKHVAKLILGVTAVDSSFLAAAQQNLLTRGTPEQIAWGEKLFQHGFSSDGDYKNFFKAMATLYSNKARQDGVNIAAFDHMILSHECINRGFTGFLKEIDFMPELHRIKCPTLVFGGRDDWVCPPEYSEKIAAAIAGATLVMFECSGHSVPMDEPEKYIKMLRDFVLTAPS